MTAELKGRVAFVTGAGRNIGRAIALALSEDGASVAVNARANKDEADAVVAEIEAAGGNALAVLGDVADPAAAEAMIAAAAQHFGRIDILVNNAAIRAEQPLETVTHKDWRRILDVILDGAFLCTRAAL